MTDSDFTALRMVSAGEALAAAFGATGIKGSPGGWNMESSITVQAALRRAAALGMNPEWADKRLRECRDAMHSRLDLCDSPIERRLLPHLVFANYGPGFASFPAELHFPKVDMAPPEGDIIIIPQFAFVRYRLDFAVIGIAGEMRKIVGVECDGEAFHQDAMKQRERDGYFAGFGVEVMHFSGSDIHKDPAMVAGRVATRLADWRACH